MIGNKEFHCIYSLGMELVATLKTPLENYVGGYKLLPTVDNTQVLFLVAVSSDHSPQVLFSQVLFLYSP